MKYLIIFAILAYLYHRFIYQPVIKIKSSQNRQRSKVKTEHDTHHDEYIDYEEVE